MFKLSFFIPFVVSQYTPLPPVPTVDLSGKTYIVTGANVGLGFEAAKHFARLNPKQLILAVRSVEKGEEAVTAIKKETNYTGDIAVWPLDLASFQSTRDFARRCNDTLERLDALVANAAIATVGEYTQTADGFEQGLQTNVLCTALLALLLLPLLRRTAKEQKDVKPRLVIVGSEVHALPEFKEHTEDKILAALNDQSRFAKGERYPVTKLLDLFFVRELAEKLRDSSIAEDRQLITTCVNPGFCYSALRREMANSWGMWAFERLLARSTEMGSRTLVHAAIARDADAKQTGAYLSDCRVAPTSEFSVSEEGVEAQKKIWAELMEILAERAPEVKDILQN